MQRGNEGHIPFLRSIALSIHAGVPEDSLSEQVHSSSNRWRRCIRTVKQTRVESDCASECYQNPPSFSQQELNKVDAMRRRERLAWLRQPGEDSRADAMDESAGPGSSASCELNERRTA